MCVCVCTCTRACVLSLQSCLTLCDPMNCSPPGSSVHGILQARILEWVAFPSPGDLPHTGIEPVSPALQAYSLLLSYWGSTYLSIYLYLYVHVCVCVYVCVYVYIYIYLFFRIGI